MIMGALYVQDDGTEAILTYGDIKEDKYILKLGNGWSFEGNFETISARWEFKTK
jgi:hypothetical protein